MSSPATEPPADPIVDWEQAAQRVPGGPDGVAQLAGLMQAECRTVLQSIRSGIDSGQMDVVRRGAHTLKGSASIFGADPVVEAAQRLETMGREGRLDEAEAVFQELSRHAERFLVELSTAPVAED